MFRFIIVLNDLDSRHETRKPFKRYQGFSHDLLCKTFLLYLPLTCSEQATVELDGINLKKNQKNPLTLDAMWLEYQAKTVCKGFRRSAAHQLISTVSEH